MTATAREALDLARAAYDRHGPNGGFTRHEFGVWSTAARGKKGLARDRRLEVVWASPRAAAPTLFAQEAS